MREYYWNNNDANLDQPAFHATSSLRLQGHDMTSRQTNATELKPQNQRRKPLSPYKSGVSPVKIGSSPSPSAFMINTSRTLVCAMSHAASQLSPKSSDELSLLVVRLNALLTMTNVAFCRVCMSRNHKTSQCSFIQKIKRDAFTSFCNANIQQLSTRAMRGNERSDRE